MFSNKCISCLQYQATGLLFPINRLTIIERDVYYLALKLYNKLLAHLKDEH